MIRWMTASALAVLVCSAPGRAQEVAEELPEMVTDRPDFTESSEVVGKGVMQLEMGAVMDFDNAAGSKSLSLGTPLLRWGMGKRWELRIAGDGHFSEFSAGGRNGGLADLELGMKYKFRDESKWVPAFGIIPFLGTPSGVQAVSAGRFDPGVKFTWAKDVPHGFSLSGNLNAARVAGSQSRFIQKAVTLSVGHDLIAGFGGFWEAFAFAPFDNGTGPNWVFDMGLTRMQGRNFQWDVTWGHRMNAIGPDWFIQAGATVRRKPGAPSY